MQPHNHGAAGFIDASRIPGVYICRTIILTHDELNSSNALDLLTSKFESALQEIWTYAHCACTPRTDCAEHEGITREDKTGKFMGAWGVVERVIGQSPVDVVFNNDTAMWRLLTEEEQGRWVSTPLPNSFGSGVESNQAGASIPYGVQADQYINQPVYSWDIETTTRGGNYLGIDRNLPSQPIHEEVSQERA